MLSSASFNSSLRVFILSLVTKRTILP